MNSFVETTASHRRGARTLEGRYYTSEEIFAEEVERIQERSWICAGRLRDLTEPGAYFTIEIGRESVIVLRAGDDSARAFHNVCRHRGTRICADESGRFEGYIQCPYHAWSYGLDGRLLRAPHMAETDGFDRADHPLHSVRLELWEGFIFLCLDPGAGPFSELVAPLRDRFARFGLSQLRLLHREEYEVAANWKLILQNYSECLHCPTIHPELALLIPYRSGANDLTEGPFLGGYMLLREPHASATPTGAACGVQIGEGREEERRRVYYYTVFPFMMLGIHPDYVVHYRVDPLAAGRSRVVCEWLFHPDSFDDAEHEPRAAVEFWRLTNEQDWFICEQSQRGVSSSVYRPGPYSPRESMTAAWDREYLRVMGRLK